MLALKKEAAMLQEGHEEMCEIPGWQPAIKQRPRTYNFKELYSTKSLVSLEEVPKLQKETAQSALWFQHFRP